MQRTRITAFVALLLLASEAVIAQEELLDEPRSLEQITFTPPTSASIRLTNGVRRTGKIVSISRESMVYQVGRDNKEVTVEIDDIARVNTLDNEFTYEPEDEDFERLKIKARRIGFLTVQTVQTYVPPPDGGSPAVVEPVPVIPDPQPDVPPAVTTDPPPVVNVTPTVTSPTVPTTPEPAVEIPDDDPQPGQLILFCSNCQGRLPLSIKNGEPCPHCGTALINSTPGRAPARTVGGHGAASNAGAGTAAYPEVTGVQAGGGGVGAAPAAGADGGGQVSARGFELSQVPVWMQVGFFVGLLAIGWLLLQRR